MGKSLVSRGTGSSKLEEEEEGAGVLLVIAAVMYLTGDQQNRISWEKNKSITSRDVEFILVHVCLHVCF